MSAGSSVHVTALLLAAGKGERIAATDTVSHKIPKQHLPMTGGKKGVQTSLLMGSLCRLLAHPLIDDVAIVHYNLDELFALEPDIKRLLPKITLVVGGETRYQSTAHGLEALANSNVPPDIVVIHDAARPFVCNEIIERTITTVTQSHDIWSVYPALCSTNTIRNSNHETLDREEIYTVQTPQAFVFSKLISAHRACRKGEISVPFTDDVAVMEAIYGRENIARVEGEQSNHKITYPQDLNVNINRQQEQELSTNCLGTRYKHRHFTAFDIHRMELGGVLHLGGITLDTLDQPYHLIGHSDADAVLHAITDALLAAAGSHDIGTHFPPQNPQWKDARSSIFVEYAYALLMGKQGILLGVDVTIIAQSPKLAPHIGHMRKSLAHLLKLNQADITIKATTAEHLGVIGQGKALAVIAGIDVMLP